MHYLLRYMYSPTMVLSQAVAPFVDILLVMFISLGSMPNCWRGPEYSEEKFCGKGIELNRAIHSSWILSLSTWVRIKYAHLGVYLYSPWIERHNITAVCCKFIVMYLFNSFYFIFYLSIYIVSFNLNLILLMYRPVYIVLCNTYMHAMQLHSIVRINNWIELNKNNLFLQTDNDPIELIESNPENLFCIPTTPAEINNINSS